MMFKNQCMLSLLILPRLIQNNPISHKQFKGLTQCSYLPLRGTLIYTTEYILTRLTTKPWQQFIYNCQLQTKTTTDAIEMNCPQLYL